MKTAMSAPFRSLPHGRSVGRDCYEVEVCDHDDFAEMLVSGVPIPERVMRGMILLDQRDRTTATCRGERLRTDLERIDMALAANDYSRCVLTVERDAAEWSIHEIDGTWTEAERVERTSAFEGWLEAVKERSKR